ncbi:hypothetical protein CLAVI_000109 [Candidatus Clavichlamydia salmonicola]|uniref:hypothetical protein n=1 Tax=Candidatus Clavichlamydia salmonicola TaxID=469812 RepID=UPI001890FC5D|nr:hypothetical protein [Candidatus Clavichlamydia salmonicola]MBF5050503.1 hypothetical protein [Candidatus Clavichlamydia salmonicola]
MYKDLLKDSSVEVELLKKLREKSFQREEFSAAEEKKIQKWVERLKNNEEETSSLESVAHIKARYPASPEGIKSFLTRLYEDLI